MSANRHSINICVEGKKDINDGVEEVLMAI
jgi:hypothetical protein